MKLERFPASVRVTLAPRDAATLAWEIQDAFLHLPVTSFYTGLRGILDALRAAEKEGVREETPAQRRALLVAALRAPMPEGFEFDFGIVSTENECATKGCAMGLAAQMWPEHAKMLTRFSDDQRAAFFGISVIDAYQIFWGEYHTYPQSGDITPAMVADALEAAGGAQ